MIPSPRNLKALLAAVLVACLPVTAKENKSSHKALASKIESLLSASDVANSYWGIEILPLDAGKPWYALNSDKLFVPASNAKLFTTSAALALVGADYKFHTTVETPGSLDKYGRVSGDVILGGRGDPNLSGRTLPYVKDDAHKQSPLRVLEDMADQLVRRGVKVIDGDIVGDDSYYVFERYGEGWASDDMLWDYGAPVSALTINDNVLFVNLRPGERAGDKALITPDPPVNYYHISNGIVTTPASSGPRKIGIHREPGSLQLTLWGTIPLDDSGDDEVLAIEDPAEFAAQAFRDLLERRGIVIFGAARARHTEVQSLPPTTGSDTVTLPPAPPAAPSQPSPPTLPTTVLANYDSPPLIEDLTVINKVSQNLHAEMALRLLGKIRGTGGSVEGGIAVLSGFLTQIGIRPEEYAFYDGSGLSRQTLVTPQAIIKLLQYDATQPWAAQFQRTLPLSGVDGSLAERFKTTSAEGRVQAKTGALDHVNALSGYLTTLNGERVAFSIVVNNHHLTWRRTKQVIDQIVEAVVEEGASKRK